VLSAVGGARTPRGDLRADSQPPKFGASPSQKALDVAECLRVLNKIEEFLPFNVVAFNEFQSVQKIRLENPFRFAQKHSICERGAAHLNRVAKVAKHQWLLLGGGR
jgi:hypothetical protein